MTMALAVAMVACSGAAGTPGEPGKDAVPVKLPPLTGGTIPAMALVVGGDAGMVDLSGYFSDPQGQTLTYAATSSMTAYATATVDQTTATVTVTAVAAGKSTIAVTATDPDRLTATQTFMVTVTAAGTTPEPEPEPDPGTITIPDTTKVPVDLNDHLPAGAAADYVLESRDETVFTVAQKSTSTGPSKSVWEVNPVSKGTAKAEIISKKDAAVAVTLTVVVQNRKPGFDSKAPVISKLTLMGPVPHMPPTGTPTLKNENADGTLNLYHVELPVGSQFKDPDAADQAAGELTYNITSSRDDVLVRGGGSCTTAKCKVWMDILKKRGNDDFALNVVAEDSDMTESGSVSFPISMEYPASQMYKVGQRTTGSFRSITVGDRASDETEHTLEFTPVPVAVGATAIMAFGFAQSHLDRLDALVGGTTNPSDVAEVNDPDGVPPETGSAPSKKYYINETLPTDLKLRARATALAIAGEVDAYTVRTTGRVKVSPMKIGSSDPSLTLDSTGSANPMLVFTVSGTGTGTIEIGYHVWWDQDGAAGTTHMPKWHFATETLTVTVVAVK